MITSIKVIRFNRLVFGVSASLNMCRDHAEDQKVKFPMAANTILHFTYMDVSMDSVFNGEMACDVYQQLSKLWKWSGCMQGNSYRA